MRKFDGSLVDHLPIVIVKLLRASGSEQKRARRHKKRQLTC
jgi:hypothetical protein